MSCTRAPRTRRTSASGTHGSGAPRRGRRRRRSPRRRRAARRRPSRARGLRAARPEPALSRVVEGERGERPWRSQSTRRRPPAGGARGRPPATPTRCGADPAPPAARARRARATPWPSPPARRPRRPLPARRAQTPRRRRGREAKACAAAAAMSAVAPWATTREPSTTSASSATRARGDSSGRRPANTMARRSRMIAPDDARERTRRILVGQPHERVLEDEPRRARGEGRRDHRLPRRIPSDVAPALRPRRPRAASAPARRRRAPARWSRRDRRAARSTSRTRARSTRAARADRAARMPRARGAPPRAAAAPRRAACRAKPCAGPPRPERAPAARHQDEDAVPRRHEREAIDGGHPRHVDPQARSFQERRHPRHPRSICPKITVGLTPCLLPPSNHPGWHERRKHDRRDWHISGRIDCETREDHRELRRYTAVLPQTCRGRPRWADAPPSPRGWRPRARCLRRAWSSVAGAALAACASTTVQTSSDARWTSRSRVIDAALLQRRATP